MKTYGSSSRGATGWVWLQSFFGSSGGYTVSSLRLISDPLYKRLKLILNIFGLLELTKITVLPNPKGFAQR